MRMLSWFIAAVAAGTPPGAAVAGQQVGNGGDVIVCRPSPANSLSGPLSLDYALTTPSDPSALVGVSSWQESFFRIRRNIDRKVPELVPSFDDFVRQIRSPDLSGRRVWESTPLELVDVEDEALPNSVRIPENCRDQGVIRLVQAVVRQFPDTTGSSRQIVYKYVPGVLDQLEKEAPLQLSFLFVHEWLWDLSQDVARNRRVDFYLHSADFDRDDAAKARATLRNLGLDVEAIPRVIAADGTGHFRTLAEALATHRDGETLVIRRGIYSEVAVQISRPVHLVGEGGMGDVIVRTALGVHASSPAGAALENLTLQRPIQSLDQHGMQPVVDLLAGSIEFKNVAIEGGRFGIVMAQGTQADFTEGRIVTDRVAVFMDDGASGRFVSSRFAGNSAFQFDSPDEDDPDSVSRNHVEIHDNLFCMKGMKFRGKPDASSVVSNNTSTDDRARCEQKH